MPEPQRQNLQKLTDSVVAQLAQAIAEGRKLSPEDARRLIDTGPHSPEEAKSAKLIDQISLLDRSDGQARSRGQTPPIAVVHPARPRRSCRGGRPHRRLGHDRRRHVQPARRRGGHCRGRYGEAMHDAADDEDVAAIILRIDSPGGSYVASDDLARDRPRQGEETRRGVDVWRCRFWRI